MYIFNFTGKIAKANLKSDFYDLTLRASLFVFSQPKYLKVWTLQLAYRKIGFFLRFLCNTVLG